MMPLPMRRVLAARSLVIERCLRHAGVVPGVSVTWFARAVVAQVVTMALLSRIRGSAE